ncbi:Hypothetical predicted protein [Mytilus galloprovincialis]|uniref:Integrase catalytic domain-containing protein n=1 Tax=Mytilus galloprovincialis TaxID=29158 RepID=A0A8B6H7Y7_MYTGA|nr:Hypothetical predicted protein [Mytilus galloprovincialis]
MPTEEERWSGGNPAKEEQIKRRYGDTGVVFQTCLVLDKLLPPKAMTYLMNQKANTGKLTRWAMDLQHYNFEIKYRKGCNNQVADALSRRSYPEQPDDENEVAAVKVSEVNTRTEASGNDKTFESIQVEFFYDDYTMVAPLDPVIARPELSNLPAIAKLQQNCHDFGNMYKFLTQGILPADNDQSSKVQKSAQDYSICNNVLYKWFQKRVRVDNGEKWIKQLCLPQALREDALLSYHDSFLDSFSKWSEAFPMKTQEASEVAKVLFREIISRYGAMKCLVTDLGRNFVSNLVNALCEMLNITRHHTSSYHPQTNGLVERTNSTLIQAVRAYSDKDQNNWPNKLPGILMAFRNSPSTQSTEYSPFLNGVRQGDELTF